MIVNEFTRLPMPGSPDADPARVKDRYRVARYQDLSVAQIDLMLAQQDNRCACCKEPFKRIPNIDHDHTSGEVRGLLCTACNSGLGQFRDSIPKLLKACMYLDPGFLEKLKQALNSEG